MPHLLLLATLFSVSLLVGAYLPDQIPLHWDDFGVVDRIGTKYELIFLLPLAATAVFAAGAFAESRIILPSHKIRGFMSFMQFFFLVLFFVIQARNLLRAGHIWLPTERLMAIPALLLYVYVGSMFYDAEYLSLFGIKTKWTLNSRIVWVRTNRLASRMFIICAALMVIPLFFYTYFYILLTVPPVLSFIASVVYSKIISRSAHDEDKE